MVFSVFTELCSCHHNITTLSSPQKETLYPLAVTFYLSLPYPLVTMNLLSVSMVLLIRTFHINGITTCDLCDWLLSLSIMFQGSPCSTYQYFIPFLNDF